MSFDVVAARRLAADLFTQGSDRWLHAQAVARKAEQIAPVAGPIDRDLLLCAAWLHEAGLSPSAVRSGFHPLDGAVLLAEAGWPERVVAQVAHQCEARVTAAALDLDGPLGAFRREEGAVTDALVYADMAAGPDGRRLSLRERLDEMDRKHPEDKPRLREAWTRRRAALLSACGRTEQRMAGVRRTRGRAAVVLG